MLLEETQLLLQETTHIHGQFAYLGKILGNTALMIAIQPWNRNLVHISLRDLLAGSPAHEGHPVKRVQVKEEKISICFQRPQGMGVIVHPALFPNYLSDCVLRVRELSAILTQQH